MLENEKKLLSSFMEVPHLAANFLNIKSECLLDLNNVGNECSLISGSSPTIVGNYLYTTSPIKSLNNSILMFLSSVAPERTIILLVKKNWDLKIMYDSLDVGNKCQQVDLPTSFQVGAVMMSGNLRVMYSAKVIEENHILFTEGGNRDLESKREISVRVAKERDCFIHILQSKS